MLMVILSVGALGLGWLLACGSLPPEGSDPRLRWVERHPGEVDAGDIERMMLRHGLSPADVRLVTQRASALGIRPFTMWLWIQAYSARELAVAVAADLRHDELLDHLCQGTPPDFHELEVFAGLNGLEAVTGGVGPVATPAVLEARSRVRTPDERPAEPRRLPPGWDSFFDDLAG